MILKTKYSINDKCYKIFQAPLRTWVKCPACAGAGEIILANGARSCPDCYGDCGKWQYGKEAWQVDDVILTIGEVRAYARNFKKSGMFDNVGSYVAGNDTLKVEYMCYETGVGSGTIHSEESLWPDEASAIAECERLNNLIKNNLERK